MTHHPPSPARSTRSTRDNRNGDRFRAGDAGRGNRLTYRRIAHRDRLISRCITQAGAPTATSSTIRTFSRSDNPSTPHLPIDRTDRQSCCVDPLRPRVLRGTAPNAGTERNGVPLTAYGQRVAANRGPTSDDRIAASAYSPSRGSLLATSTTSRFGWSRRTRRTTRSRAKYSSSSAAATRSKKLALRVGCSMRSSSTRWRPDRTGEPVAVVCSRLAAW